MGVDARVEQPARPHHPADVALVVDRIGRAAVAGGSRFPASQVQVLHEVDDTALEAGLQRLAGEVYDPDLGARWLTFTEEGVGARLGGVVFSRRFVAPLVGEASFRLEGGRRPADHLP